MGPSVPENPDDRLIYPLGFTLCAWTLLGEWGGYFRAEKIDVLVRVSFDVGD